jgi:hypothetical protein
MHSTRKKKKSEARKSGLSGEIRNVTVQEKSRMSGKSGYSRKISGLSGLSAHQ